MGKSLTRSLGLILIVLAVLAGTFVVAAEREATSGEESRDSAGLLVITTMSAYGRLSEPGALFPHDLHTAVLEKSGKDCVVCHEKTGKGNLDLRFKRTRDDLGADELKALYHGNCLGCHEEAQAKSQKAGPTDVECRACHARRAAPVTRLPVGMDRSLHARHVKAQADKCESCHHRFDEQSKKLVYAKGEEGTCRYCHGATQVENRSPFRTAAHGACVSCHLQKRAAAKDTGPLNCAGCHSAEDQARVKRLPEIPRLDRKQPDVVLIGAALVGGQAQDPAKRMPAVPFDHKVHEQVNADCRTCHHKALSGCGSECHTLSGSPKGEFVRLDAAMHGQDLARSCIGCHAVRTQAPECAGCHSMRTSSATDEKSCAACHRFERRLDAQGQPVLLDKAAASAQAATLLSGTESGLASYSDQDIPEKVIIKAMAQAYEPAEFPHRKIVRKLEAGIKASPLAARFHRDQSSVCQGCHHNSPSSKNPPACASCHGKPTDGSLARIGLKGAYHEQCIGCHQAMKMEKPAATACVECHKERKQ
ncbi:class III cytochrome C family protein [Desulfocurvibacter africanus PCS]|uniref:Class III cytochrome C family protein n=1 Tax=Desulfocurvibacter africanus PCS TaxID=1262666 RepID=M5PSE9_DESAF|nr:class III cytochrome C family protein [Desulfocurvibacter africanus PCS]